MGNDNASGTLKLAVGLGITAIVLIIVVVAFNFGRNAANNAISNLSNETTQIEESRYTMYDGSIITGAEVVNLISKYANDPIYIWVDVNDDHKGDYKTQNEFASPNGSKATYYIFTSDDIKTNTTSPSEDLRNAQDPSDPDHYVNPSSKFYGKVMRNKDTRAIRGIAFWRIS